MSYSSNFDVKGFSGVTVIHNSDWSGEIKIITFPLGYDPNALNAPHQEVTIPDGVLPALFKSVVREFLRVTAEEGIERLLDFARKRNPWG